MREIQSEFFAKDASLSIAIAIATYTTKFDGVNNSTSRKTISYGVGLRAGDLRHWEA